MLNLKNIKNCIFVTLRQPVTTLVTALNYLPHTTLCIISPCEFQNDSQFQEKTLFIETTRSNMRKRKLNKLEMT